MMAKKMLIVDKMHRSIGPMLAEIGWEADYLPSISRQEILDTIGDYHGIIVRSKTVIDRELIAKAEKLEVLARAGAGLDQIDRPAIEERGITLINAPEGNRSALGEHAVGMLLTLMHKINRADKEVRDGRWNREANRGMELGGKTVGVYGFGYMGSAFAEKLAGFGCRVIAYDKYKEGFGDRQVQEVTLAHFEEETEILSIHVPLTSETKNYFDAAYLRRYPNLKFIINTSRGEVLPLAGLLELLEEGRLMGAGLDVLENEKMDAFSAEETRIFNALAAREDVVFTPHVAGWTVESYIRINEVIVKKMVEMGLGKHLARTSRN